MIKLTDILQEIKHGNIVYHGTPEKHSFETHGYLNKATFFSYSKDEAKSYGEYIYEVKVKSGLDIFDYVDVNNAQRVIDENGTLIDPYDDGEIINGQQLASHSDIWEVVERQYMYGFDLFNAYGVDGFIVTEGGILTLVLRTPVLEKIESVHLL